MGNSRSSQGLFRNGSYHKSVTMGKRRVKDGECCAIWDSSGNVRNVIGPKLEWIFMSDVRFLDRYIANQNEYLIVSFSDGRKQHVRGPSSLFLDPVVHKSIIIQQAVSLNAFEAIVVYQEVDTDRDNGIDASGENNDELFNNLDTKKKMPIAKAIQSSNKNSSQDNERSVNRRIIRGPTLFIPAANEWIHEFSWHGPSNPRSIEDRTLVKDQLKLTKIRTLPDQLYYNVTSCRTSDDAQLCVKLMIFYQLINLETMLDSTHDPIGDFANAVSADVIKFTGNGTFEEFVKTSGELNDIKAFPVLIERAHLIGYRIDKIVFRGYKASDQLQAMHDAAIKGRTKLQLDTRTAEQEQFLENMKLTNKLDRNVKECEMESSKRQHELNLKSLEHEQLLKQKHAEILALHQQQIQENKLKLEYLSSLAKEGVDLTKYLCAMERKSEKIISIETPTGGVVPHIHLDGSKAGL